MHVIVVVCSPSLESSPGNDESVARSRNLVQNSNMKASYSLNPSPSAFRTPLWNQLRAELTACTIPGPKGTDHGMGLLATLPSARRKKG